MFGSIGGPELLVIFVVALLIFGPRRLAEIGRGLGKGLAEFRRAASDLRQTLDAEVSRPEPPVPPRIQASVAGEPDVTPTGEPAPRTPDAGSHPQR